MSEHRSTVTPRHRGGRRTLAFGLPLALAAAGGLAYGLFGADTSSATSTSSSGGPPP
ncbi:hypothetical protein ABZ079_31175 [Streptomyces sp. NPDC006314]|uniref:hypothetical protein n=1 Tax=Streptomyces sp. NPDC006314 TaxID=3154475 RepID=UPI00339EE158